MTPGRIPPQTSLRIFSLFIRYPTKCGVRSRMCCLSMPPTRPTCTIFRLSTKCSETFFPLTYGPYVLPQPHQVITIVFVNGNHFIHVKLDGEYPMPLPNHVWMCNRSEDASLWYELYEHRIQSFIHIMNPNPDYNVHDIG